MTSRLTDSNSHTSRVGNTRDCSINDVVQVWYPAPVLFDAGALTWSSGTREWRNKTRVTVAKFVESGSYRALIVREDWLKGTLRRTKPDMVFGWLGEKRLLEKDGIVGGWTEISAVASLDRGRWVFGQRRLEIRHQ